MATRTFEIIYRDKGAKSLADHMVRAADAQDRVIAGRDKLAAKMPAPVGQGGGRKAQDRIFNDRELKAMEKLGTPGAIFKDSELRALSNPKFLQGPNQLLEKIERQMVLAKALKDPAAIADLEMRRARAQRAKVAGERLLEAGEEGIHAPGLLTQVHRIHEMLYDLKRGDLTMAGFRGGQVLNTFKQFSGGLNIQQKVGLGASPAGTKVIGGGPAGGGGAGANLGAALLEFAPAIGAGIAAALSGGALFAMARAAGPGAERSAVFSQVQAVTGGTPGEVARASMFGVEPTAANEFRNRITSDPMARIAASRVGISPQLPEPFGPTDNAKIFLEALDGLRKIVPFEERLRTARMLGLQAALESTKISNSLWAKMMETGDRAAQIGELTEGPSRELNAAKKRRKKESETFFEAIGLPFMGSEEKWEEAQGDMFGWLNDRIAAAHGKKVKNRVPILDDVNEFGEWLSKWQGPKFGPKGFDMNLPAYQGDGGAAAGQSDAEKQTRLLEQIAALLEQGLGGGERARGAVSPAMMGEFAFGQHLQLSAHALRSFRQ